MKIRDASQQKTVQLSVCAWEKTNNITQWTVDSKPHKNNCLFGPHGPKLKALLYHTKRKEYTARPSMGTIKNENPLAHCCNLTTK